MNTNLKKSNSHINGLGIFTTDSIQKNTEFYSIPLSVVYSEPQPKCARISDGRYVSDEKVLNWVNHSCNPNSKLDIDRPDPVLLSIRAIASDEEISVDYNQTEVQGIEVECTCKASNCKGYFSRL